MPRTIDPAHDLLFGLRALQNGLIDQGALFAAFAAWTREKGRPLADQFVDRDDVDPDQRALLEALVALQLKKYGGDADTSLAAIPADRAVRESLAQLGDPDINATLASIVRMPSPPTTPTKGPSASRAGRRWSCASCCGGSWTCATPLDMHIAAACCIGTSSRAT
jgi:hypothetical protein